MQAVIRDVNGNVLRPPDRVCRGCAGTGVGHHVDARTVQLLIGRAWAITKPPTAVVTRPKPYLLCVNPIEYRSRGRLQGPLAVILAELKLRREAGYSEDGKGLIDGQEATFPVPYLPEHACEWCSGTGVPQLSVQTMTQEVRST